MTRRKLFRRAGRPPDSRRDAGATVAERCRLDSRGRLSLRGFLGRITNGKTYCVTMPGDGIGNQVLPEALRVLKAVGFDAEYVHADIGWDIWCNEGNALPDRTIELLKKHKLGLFGAITSKPNKEAQAELKPELRARGWFTTARS